MERLGHPRSTFQVWDETRVPRTRIEGLESLSGIRRKPQRKDLASGPKGRLGKGVGLWVLPGPRGEGWAGLLWLSGLNHIGRWA